MCNALAGVYEARLGLKEDLCFEVRVTELLGKDALAAVSTGFAGSLSTAARLEACFVNDQGLHAD